MCSTNLYSAENTLTFNRSVCGRTVANSTIDSRFGTAPWNVGVYRYNDDEDVYEMICGGSLIGTNLVVSGENFAIYALGQCFKTVFFF